MKRNNENEKRENHLKRLFNHPDFLVIKGYLCIHKEQQERDKENHQLNEKANENNSLKDFLKTLNLTALLDFAYKNFHLLSVDVKVDLLNNVGFKLGAKNELFKEQNDAVFIKGNLFGNKSDFKAFIEIMTQGFSSENKKLVETSTNLLEQAWQQADTLEKKIELAKSLTQSSQFSKKPEVLTALFSLVSKDELANHPQLSQYINGAYMEKRDYIDPNFVIGLDKKYNIHQQEVEPTRAVNHSFKF
ncbi:hypothetical protein B0187_01320 [Haemophilus paracuniculus]|uniref:Uncharacterized protein n=2 Tax=Haemophilus paracuniculus TaxID=734 RepID=A0A1T0AUT4_9PAST|nr:hypothetical protein B0187_01320 [Haemophilus paracuniculus]